MARKVAPSRSRDARIGRIAADQHGVITHAQLRACDLGSSAISKRARSGRLHRVHQGVYVVGHRGFGRETLWMAAVRACGDGAVLSHASAAALWGLLRPEEGPVDVSVPTHGGRGSREGIRIHRCPSLAAASLVRHADEEPIAAITIRDGIPVTAPWRTIDDLRRAVARGLLAAKHQRRAVREAELRRYALSPRTPRDRTRSDLERDFLALCRAHRLPTPEVNVRIGRWTVDFFWPRARLVAETDSWATHGGSVAFEDDYERDLGLRGLGFEVRRYTDHLLETAPDQVVADLRERLAHGERARKLDV